MKHNLGDRERLLHILEAIDNIESFLESMDFDEFIGSKFHRAATERQLEIIGGQRLLFRMKLKKNTPKLNGNQSSDLETLSFTNILA